MEERPKRSEIIAVPFWERAHADVFYCTLFMFTLSKNTFLRFDEASTQLNIAYWTPPHYVQHYKITRCEKISLLCAHLIPKVRGHLCRHHAMTTKNFDFRFMRRIFSTFTDPFPEKERRHTNSYHYLSTILYHPKLQFFDPPPHCRIEFQSERKTSGGNAAKVNYRSEKNPNVIDFRVRVRRKLYS